MGPHSRPAARRRGVFSRLSTLVFVSLVAVASAADIDPKDVSTPSPDQIFARDDEEPTNFGWVKKWAAIGDSFIAGISSVLCRGKDINRSRHRLRPPAEQRSAA